MKKGYLVLQDGQVFEGFRFGGPADAVGELVFTTGMCGYLETLTDPSYGSGARSRPISAARETWTLFCGTGACRGSGVWTPGS